MNTLQLRALAVAAWLVTLACGIAFLGMHEDYADFRDDTHITGTVANTEPMRNKLRVDVTFRWGDHDDTHRMYVSPSAEAAYRPGTAVTLFQHNGELIDENALADKAPPLWLLPLAFLALGLGVWIWRAPSRAARRRAAHTDPLDAVVDSIARTRNTSFGLAGFLAVATVMFAVVPFADATATAGERGGVLALAGLSAVCTALLLRRGLRFKDPRNNELIDLITRRPADIAWIYVLHIRVRGMDTYNAVIHTTTRKRYAIVLVDDDRDALMAELGRRAPHAIRDNTPENRALYKQDPTRWRPTAG